MSRTSSEALGEHGRVAVTASAHSRQSVLAWPPLSQVTRYTLRGLISYPSLRSYSRLPCVFVSLLQNREINLAMRCEDRFAGTTC